VGGDIFNIIRKRDSEREKEEMEVVVNFM